MLRRMGAWRAGLIWCSLVEYIAYLADFLYDLYTRKWQLRPPTRLTSFCETTKRLPLPLDTLRGVQGVMTADVEPNGGQNIWSSLSGSWQANDKGDVGTFSGTHNLSL